MMISKISLPINHELGLYTSKLILLHTAFLHNMKRFGCKIGIQFNKSVLVVE